MKTPANLIIMQLSSIIRIFSIFIVAITGTTGIESPYDVKDNEFNHVVSITDMCTAEHLCVGAIIDELHILTAAHCVHHRWPEGLIILAGFKVLIDPQTITRRVIEIHIHEKYDPSSNPPGNVSRRDSHLMYEGNDIAVLKVEIPYTWKGQIESIGLPPRGGGYDLDGFVAGWGRNHLNKRLQWLLMGRYANCVRREAYHGSDEFCAVHDEGPDNVFPEDSGAPITRCQYVFGIISVSGNPAIFTSVRYHRGFIEKIINR